MGEGKGKGEKGGWQSESKAKSEFADLIKKDNCPKYNISELCITFLSQIIVVFS